MRAHRSRARGFTLLEVMISLAILSVALVAIAGINSGAMNMHLYAKRLTIGTLLARGKMAAIESKLQAEGLPSDDNAEDGAFDEDGFPDYHWEAQIIRPKTENVNVANLLAMTGMGLEGPGKSKDGKGSADPMSGLLSQVSGVLGGGAPGTMGAGAAGAAGAAAMAGGAGGLLGGAMSAQFQKMLDDLGKTVREVRLTVSWKNGKQLEKFTVVSHFVSLGAGTDQAQSDAAAQALQNATNPDGTLKANSLMRPDRLNQLPRMPGLGNGLLQVGPR